LGRRVQSIETQDLAANRGLQGAMLRVVVHVHGSDDALSFILKTTQSASLSADFWNIATGKFREAMFYNHVQSSKITCPFRLPRVVYAHGSRFAGSCVVLMEDVNKMTPEGCVGVNHFFGNQVWGAATSELPATTSPQDVWEQMVLGCAELHARYWCDRKTLFESMPWLKSANWYQGKGRAEWEVALERSREIWEYAKANAKIEFSEKLVRVIDRSYAESSWDKLQAHLANQQTPVTLVHGDFHASNMLWVRGEQHQRSLVVVDWSETGVWEPMADLGQTVISDMLPAFWRDTSGAAGFATLEQQMIHKYWERLTQLLPPGAPSYSWSQCWAEYEVASAERWIWFLSLLGGFPIPPKALQYFHDQLLAFIEAHGDHPFYILKPLGTIA
jgi:hypothetical protein